MQEGAFAGEARVAVGELQAYLSDRVAPLLVADALDVLLRQPPELGAEAIRSWAAQQAPGNDIARLAEAMVRAIKKIQLLGDLSLAPKEQLDSYLRGSIGVLAGAAPEAQRPALHNHLLRATGLPAGPLPSAVGTAGTAVSAGAAGAAGAPGATASAAAGSPGGAPAAATSGLPGAASAGPAARQFSLLLAQVAARGASGEQLDPAERDALAAHLLVAAARGAGSQREFEHYLSRLSQAGMMKESRLSELFPTLSRGIAEWSICGPDGAPAFESAPVEAIRRIVTLAGDRIQAAGHFRELLRSAAQQLNSGSLARAAQVLEVARRLLAENRVERSSADLALENAHEDLDAARLMSETQSPTRLPLLRRVLTFYPGLSPRGLLAALDDEPDRSRRRLWIALLEAHGVPAREAALDRLEASFGEDDPAKMAWQQRNFIYLLQRIPPAPGTDLQREVELTIRAADLKGFTPLVRESLVNLGLRRHPAAEAALRQRLVELERLLESPATALHEPVELQRMLGTVVSGLARFGTTNARRAVMVHGLKQKPALGDALQRLAELGAADLAEDPDGVNRLVDALRAALPARVMGLRVRRTEDAAPLHLVRALSGTRIDSVRAAFTDIAQRYPDEAFGKLAAETLAAWHVVRRSGSIELPRSAAAPQISEAGAPAAPPAGPALAPSGELAAFGLPDLIQALHAARVSGKLSIRSHTGAPFAEIDLREGEIAGARAGRLSFPEALFQLLETPQPGLYDVTRAAPELVPVAPEGGVMQLLMEGLRRHQELQLARALVPDQARLIPTSVRPTARVEEADGAFIRDLWTRVKSGATARQCEDLAADAYRVRALLAHWLAEGALELAL